MQFFTIVKETVQSLLKGFGLVLFERGGYVDTAYTPGLHNHKK